MQYCLTKFCLFQFLKYIQMPAYCSGKTINLKHCLNELYSFFRTYFRHFCLPESSSSLRQNNLVVLIHSGCKQSAYLAEVFRQMHRDAQVHNTFTYSTIIHYLLAARHCSRHSVHYYITVHGRYKVVIILMEILPVYAINN